MKKIICTLIILIPSILSAQHKFSSVKLGMFSPRATETGFILGYEGGWYIDDNFLLGYSADWFNKNYVDRKLVDDYNEFYGNIYSSLNELRAKTNLHSIPLMFSVNGSWPVAPKTHAYLTGSGGLEILLIFYRDYDNPNDSKFQGAFDFCWRLGGGIMYELGQRSDAFFEIGYHSSVPSWTYDVRDIATGKKKTFERRFDMSGIMF